MANGRDQAFADAQPVGHRIWTFTITGGPVFRLGIPRTPFLDHDGVRTLAWKIAATQEVADAIATMVRALGATVTCYTEEVTPEMAAEKSASQPPSSDPQLKRIKTAPAIGPLILLNPKDHDRDPS